MADPIWTQKELEEIAERMRNLRARLAPDSPLQGIAFRLASLVGEIQAAESAGSVLPATGPEEGGNG